MAQLTAFPMMEVASDDVRHMRRTSMQRSIHHGDGTGVDVRHP
jgi:hypothetical protein